MTIIGLFVFTAENAVLFHAAQPPELQHIVGPFGLATVVRRGIWLVTFKALLFNTVLCCVLTLLCPRRGSKRPPSAVCYELFFVLC